MSTDQRSWAMKWLDRDHMSYIDGAWHTFDARHNFPRIGRVLIARGRDAVDVAFSTIYGSIQLENFKVWADKVT